MAEHWIEVDVTPKPEMIRPNGQVKIVGASLLVECAPLPGNEPPIGRIDFTFAQSLTFMEGDTAVVPVRWTWPMAEKKRGQIAVLLSIAKDYEQAHFAAKGGPCSCEPCNLTRKIVARCT